MHDSKQLHKRKLELSYWETEIVTLNFACALFCVFREVVLAVAEDSSHNNFPHNLYNKGSKVLLCPTRSYIGLQVLVNAYSVIFNALKKLFIQRCKLATRDVHFCYFS